MTGSQTALAPAALCSLFIKRASCVWTCCTALRFLSALLLSAVRAHSPAGFTLAPSLTSTEHTLVPTVRGHTARTGKASGRGGSHMSPGSPVVTSPGRTAMQTASPHVAIGTGGGIHPTGHRIPRRLSLLHPLKNEHFPNAKEPYPKHSQSHPTIHEEETIPRLECRTHRPPKR